jgi:hypothetical protein
MLINTVAKELLFSTLCLEGTDKNGSRSAGSCFLLSHEIADYGAETFLITNKHVVTGMEHSKLCFTRKVGNQPVIGHTFAFECSAGFGTTFHGHPDSEIDIAVLPISFLLRAAAGRGDRDAFITPISSSAIPTRAALSTFDAVLPILFVGYPNGMYDSVHRTPIIRRGITATPVELDYDGKPIFLIDASVFPGSSGSPVFAYSETWEGGLDGVRLLGIISQVCVQEDSGELRFAPAPTTQVPRVAIRQMLDLGVVIKSHLIIETIEDCWKHKGDELRRVNKAVSGT